MTKTVIAALLALCILVLPLRDVLAHGGDLDDTGCHNEAATGGFHCHRGGEDDGPDWDTIGAIVGGVVVVWLVVKSFETDTRGYGGLPLAPELAADQTGNAYAGVRWRLHF